MREGAASLHCGVHTHRTAEKPKHGKEQVQMPPQDSNQLGEPTTSAIFTKQYELPGTAKETKHINGRFWMQQINSMASTGASATAERRAGSCAVHTASHPTQWCAATILLLGHALWTVLIHPAADKTPPEAAEAAGLCPCQESVALMVLHPLLIPGVTLESSSLPQDECVDSHTTDSRFHD